MPTSGHKNKERFFVMNGKWIIRLTLILAVLVAFFWCIWPCFTSIPQSQEVHFLYTDRFIPSMSRSLDCVGVLMFGMLFWLARHELSGAPKAIRWLVFLGLSLMFLGGITDGVLTYGILFAGGITASMIIFGTGIVIYLFVRKGLMIVRDFYRDFSAALRRTPKTG